MLEGNGFTQADRSVVGRSRSRAHSRGLGAWHRDPVLPRWRDAFSFFFILGILVRIAESNLHLHAPRNTSLTALMQLVHKHGSFTEVMGFSQGATLAAMFAKAAQYPAVARHCAI